METVKWVVLLAACTVANGGSSSEVLHSTPVSVPATECPIPNHWNGVTAKTCADQLCKDNRDCNETGTQGFCCATSCSGRNCFYNNTLPQKGKRSAPECPHEWQGHQCEHNMCSMDHQCMQHGKKGYCCPTKCGKHNCYMPNMGKRSEPECEPDEDCPPRYKRSSHMCPSNWQGSKCGQNMCSSTSQCKKLGAKWFCCPTKCGKNNCYKSG